MSLFDAIAKHTKKEVDWNKAGEFFELDGVIFSINHISDIGSHNQSAYVGVHSNPLKKKVMVGRFRSGDFSGQHDLTRITAGEGNCHMYKSASDGPNAIQVDGKVFVIGRDMFTSCTKRFPLFGLFGKTMRIKGGGYGDFKVQTAWLMPDGTWLCSAGQHPRRSHKVSDLEVID
jgi:hypothetical protein